MGPAWALRLSPFPAGELITLHHLSDLADRVCSGDSLLIHTGWSERIGRAEHYENILRISQEVANWLVNKQVQMLGVKPQSVANMEDLEEVTRLHRLLMTGNVIILEGLCNLDQIRTEKVWSIALLIKFEGGDGAPTRIVSIEDGALVENNSYGCKLNL